MSDQWHAHTAEEGAPQHEHASHVSSKWMALTLIGMVLGVLFVIIVLVVYFNNYMSNYKSQINESTAEAEVAHDAMIAARTRLSDPSAGFVRVSIDDAMDMVITEYEGSDG